MVMTSCVNRDWLLTIHGCLCVAKNSCPSQQSACHHVPYPPIPRPHHRRLPVHLWPLGLSCLNSSARPWRRAPCMTCVIHSPNGCWLPSSAWQAPRKPAPWAAVAARHLQAWGRLAGTCAWPQRGGARDRQGADDTHPRGLLLGAAVAWPLVPRALGTPFRQPPS